MHCSRELSPHDALGWQHGHVGTVPSGRAQVPLHGNGDWVPSGPELRVAERGNRSLRRMHRCWSCFRAQAGCAGLLRFRPVTLLAPTRRRHDARRPRSSFMTFPFICSSREHMYSGGFAATAVVALDVAVTFPSRLARAATVELSPVCAP